MQPISRAVSFRAAVISLLRRGFADLASLWFDGSRPQKLLYAAGLLLMVSGLFHAGVYLVRGGGWEGSLSWRKPILFGLSGGVTAISVAWAVGLVAEAAPPSGLQHRLEALFCVAFALCMTLEVFLISAQTWRGVASHFNESTPLDYAVFYAMGVFISVVSLQILLLGAVAFARLPSLDDRSTAARAGLLLLAIGCALGFWSLYYGIARLHEGLDPGTYGARGVMKFPHGLPIHGIQYLAFQSWLMRQWSVPVLRRVLMIRLSAAGLLIITFYGLVQTLAGLGRFDFTAASLVILVSGLALFVSPFGLCAWSFLVRAGDPPHRAG